MMAQSQDIFAALTTADKLRWKRLQEKRKAGKPLSERDLQTLAKVERLNVKVSARDADAARKRVSAAGAKNIGTGGPNLHVELREACRLNFRLFCEQYLPEQFPLAWSPDHLEVIRKIEGAVLEGELFAMAMPRASGKSTLVVAAATWALLYAHRKYVTIVSSDEASAERLMSNLAVELEINDRLYESFKEVCHPIRSLEGIAQRSKGQEIDGARTRIEWTGKSLVFPTVLMPNGTPYPTSGSMVDAAGITGRIRGRQRKNADGKIMRPDLVLIDDPSTNESAKSPAQNADRLRILSSDILGLAGPGKKIAGLCTVTVIYPDDLADQLLDREKHPRWQGVRAKLLYAEPTNTKLWEEYAKLRLQGMKDGKGLSLATAFYVANREAMDAGARVGWPERYNSDEVSALQHAMNLMYNDRASFASEYQNEPLPAHQAGGAELVVDNIAARLSGIPHRIAPDEATRIVAFADVQQKALYYVVMAFDDAFAGTVIDYGTWPEQPMRHFEASSIKKTLQRKYPGGGLDAQLKNGLSDLCDYLIGQQWMTEAGLPMKIERMLIDANWGASTEAVREYCKRSKHTTLLLPTHGRYVGASSLPFNDQPRQKGDRVGLNWKIPAKQSKVAGVRYGLYDTNFWKSFAAERLLCDAESAEAFRFYGSESQDHRMIAEHCCSEYRVRTQGRGREVDEWKMRPDRTENHWWDCLVGCCVAASMLGASPEGIASKPDRSSAPQRRLNLPLASDPGMGSFGF